MVLPGPADTIAAIATPPGEGGIGIVRLSGPAAYIIADTIFRAKGRPLSSRRPRTIHYGVVADPVSGEAVDDALALLFRQPHSYTGEDVVEFSCHGGPVVVARVLDLAIRAGARVASPGEFTQRAFLNGTMDLAQAEAVCDVIRARTEEAHRVALLQREGRLSARVRAVRDDLVGALAAIEVSIDFSEDVGDLDYPSVVRRLADARGAIEALLDTARAGRIYREGLRLAIVGRPNVGKSSLLNALLGENRAIVTPLPGTTRDTIEEGVSIRGLPVVAIDTAGLRQTDDAIERIGVERTRTALSAASLAVLVVDAQAGWSADDAGIAAEIPTGRSIWTINKADLVSDQDAAALAHALAERSGGAPIVVLSASTGTGMPALEEAIASLALGGTAPADHVLVSNARHQDALRAARTSLVHAEESLLGGMPADFASIDVRGALDALGRITGETAPDEVVERIFRDFCVGK